MAGRAPKPLNAEALLNYALRLLSGRAHSLGELREKLRRRAENPGDLDDVLLKLRESGYINDRKFAESFAASRLETDGLGKMRVLRDLRQRRVAPKVAEQVVEATFRDTDETALVEAFLKRKYRAKPLDTFLADEKNLASAYRRLRYAGFSSGVSIRVLKRFAAHAEELESIEGEGGEEGSENA